MQWWWLEINEEEITRIAVGQKAFLRSEAFSAQALRATVSQITPKGAPTRKTFRVYLLFAARYAVADRNDGRKSTSSTAKRPRPLWYPTRPLAANAVQVVSDGKVERVPVTVGIRGSRNVEIIGNVSKDTTVRHRRRGSG